MNEEERKSHKQVIRKEAIKNKTDGKTKIGSYEKLRKKDGGKEGRESRI